MCANGILQCLDTNTTTNQTTNSTTNVTCTAGYYLNTYNFCIPCSSTLPGCQNCSVNSIGILTCTDNTTGSGITGGGSVNVTTNPSQCPNKCLYDYTTGNCVTCSNYYPGCNTCV